MADPTELGKLILQRRTKLRLTQQALADEIGVSRGWVAGIETGKPGGTDPLHVARAGTYLGLDRREAFRLAGYTVGEVLELFGPANGSAQPQTMDEIVQMLGALHQRARELQTGIPGKGRRATASGS